MISLVLAAAMASSEALAIVLNTRTSSSQDRYAAAVEVVERDAAAGKPLQQFVIGVTTEDDDKAARYLASSRGTIKALAEKRDNPLAWYLLSMESNDRALLERAAKGGNVQALNALGAILVQEANSATGESTNEVRRLLREGFECFSRASERRDPNAFVNVGACYMNGIGCKRNLLLAFECFRTAAQEGGHPEAMMYMSTCFDRGIGVKSDPEKAMFWRMKARACRGDKAAAKWLESRK